MPRMTHPDSDTEIEVNADQVEMYESQGWETKPATKPPKEGDDKK